MQTQLLFICLTWIFRMGVIRLNWVAEWVTAWKRLKTTDQNHAMTVYRYDTHCKRAGFDVLVSCSDELAVHSCPLLSLHRQVAKHTSGLFTVGLFCVTITWQNMFEASLQVTDGDVLSHVTVECRHLLRYKMQRDNDRSQRGQLGCDVERLKVFVNFNLHCIVRNLTRIINTSTLNPGKSSVDAHVFRHYDDIFVIETCKSCLVSSSLTYLMSQWLKENVHIPSKETMLTKQGYPDPTLLPSERLLFLLLKFRSFYKNLQNVHCL